MNFRKFPGLVSIGHFQPQATIAQRTRSSHVVLVVGVARKIVGVARKIALGKIAGAEMIGTTRLKIVGKIVGEIAGEMIGPTILKKNWR